MGDMVEIDIMVDKNIFHSITVSQYELSMTQESESVTFYTWRKSNGSYPCKTFKAQVRL